MSAGDPLYVCCSWLQHAMAEYLVLQGEFLNHKNDVRVLMRV